MITLGVETSGLTGMIALRRDGKLLTERQLEHARRRHAQTLLLDVRVLFDETGIQTRDIDTVAVSIGPGSFTGLRVGVVFAKTFAWAAGCRLVAVDTLHAIAAVAPEDCDDVSVVSDAQREQLFVGRFRRAETGDWERVGDIVVRDIDDWCRDVELETSPGFAAVGPGLSKVLDDRDVRVRLLDESLRFPGASAVAQLGEQLAERNVLADPFELEPFYLRRSSAEEKRDAMRNDPPSLKS
jgi:tRNA threonylcarbamoyladenosine biosynthesis protein TsaB